MTAQFLYDLRNTTGFISSQDLHELFSRLVGDPSPSGLLRIDIEKAQSLCGELAAEMDVPTSGVVQHVVQYTGATPERFGLLHTWSSAKSLSSLGTEEAERFADAMMYVASENAKLY